MKKILCMLLAALTLVFTGCSKVDLKDDPKLRYQSYKEIPGVTQEEIDAVEKLLAEKPRLVYGFCTSIEAFPQEDGSTGGFVSLIGNRITELFGFQVDYVACGWEDLNTSLLSYEIDLSSDFTATPERLEKLSMTDAITQRTIKIYTSTMNESLSTISKSRPIRCAFLDGSTTYLRVKDYLDMQFTPVFISNQDIVPSLFISGDIDAFIEEGVLEAAFNTYDFVQTEEFYPLTYSPVSLTTANPDIEPVISIMQKYIENGGYYELTELNRQGYLDYLKHTLSLRLTDEEKEYISLHNTVDNPVLIAYETTTYPLSFYNSTENEYQGIAVDVINNITALTGLVFQSASEPDTAWVELLEGLENDEFSLVTELLKTNQRQGRFLWSDQPYSTDTYALISRADFPDADINQVLSAKIGLIEGAGYTDIFLEWFPNSINKVYYSTPTDAFAALENGEIDLLMGSHNMLLNLTNYLEKPNFKINIAFNYSSDSFFGFNINEKILCSIISKSLRYIDTNEISGSWQRKVFDYQSKMLKDMIPYFILFLVLLIIALSVVISYYVKYRQMSKNLEILVAERTNELELQTSTLTYMIESIPDIVFCKDLNLCFTRCNKSFEKHFGYLEKDLIGKDDETGLGLPFDVAEAFRKADRDVIRGGRRIVVEEYIPAADGVVRLFETIKTPLMKDGKPVGIIGISRDITERKQTEEMLKLTFDTIDARVHVNEIDTGKILFMNKKMTEDLGGGDYIGKICWELKHTGFDEQCSFCPIPKLLESGNERYVWEEHNIQTDSYFKNTSCLIKWHDGRLVHMMHSVDITDSVRLHHELETAVAKLETVVKNYNGIIWSVEKDRRITLFDGLYLKNIGVTSEFIEGKSIYLAQDRHSDIIELVNNTFENGPQECISVIGEEIYRSHTTPVTDKLNNVVSVVGDTVEVTQTIKLQKELEAAIKTAESASKAKGDFLSRMSHEIRTPLNAVIGMIGIAQNTSDLDKIQHCLLRADTASKHLLGIINDILDMSKIEADKFELDNREFNFEKMLINITNVSGFRAEEKNQNLIVNINKNIPHSIVGDDLRISQVITNLLSNAVKFTPENGTVKLSIEMTEERGEDVTLKVEVEDNGIGITAEQKARLFTSFEQADGGIARRFGGTGLGLAISKRIVELMNGRIWVESNPGEGSKFIFTIAVKRGKTEYDATLSKKIDRVNLRILAVDDSPEVREYFKYVMESLNLPCDVASGGIEALNMVRNFKDKPYNMFFIDWLMPEMDGITLTKRIKEITGEKSIVFMISVAEWSRIEDEALAAGVKTFISKPLYPSTLLNVINECLMTEADKAKTSATLPIDRNNLDFENHSIIIAEDVEVNREIMTAVLEDSGIQIDFAENGQLAVTMFTDNPDKYSLILMDVHMPEMDGYEATSVIRSLAFDRAREIPIIAMTANVFREDVEKCLAVGMNDHIGKPVDPDLLFTKLNQYLNNLL